MATRAGAEQEKQPGGLQVFEVWKALEQEVVLVPGGGFVAADPDVRPQGLDVWGGLVCLIPDTCFACVELDARTGGVAKGRRLGAPDVAGEPHIHIIEESEQGFPRLEVAVRRLEGCSLAKGEKGWHEGISLFPAFSWQNFVGLAAVVVPNVCGCGGIKLPNKWQASVGPLHLRKCL